MLVHVPAGFVAFDCCPDGYGVEFQRIAKTATRHYTRIVRVLGARESIRGVERMSSVEDALMGRMRAARELGDVADAVRRMEHIRHAHSEGICLPPGRREPADEVMRVERIWQEVLPACKTARALSPNTAVWSWDLSVSGTRTTRPGRSF